MRYLPLLYFPASILLVDDDQNFLQAYQNQLSESIPNKILVEQNPIEIINILEKSYKINTESIQNVESFINTGYINILDIFRDKNRYNVLSVIVIDYCMPKIDGLTLAHSINSHSIRKILLTGDADSTVGVYGFNERVINKFLEKKDDNIVEKLKNYILEECENYFYELSRPLREALMKRNRNFFKDEHYINFFKTLLQKYDVTEYCLIDEYGSHLLYSEKIENLIFLVFDEQGISMFNDEVIGSDVDFKLVREHVAIPFFGVNNELDTPKIYPCNKLEGVYTNYYWTIIENIDLE